MTVVAKTVAEFAAELGLLRHLVECSQVSGEPVHTHKYNRRGHALVIALPNSTYVCTHPAVYTHDIFKLVHNLSHTCTEYEDNIIHHSEITNLLYRLSPPSVFDYMQQ